LLLSVLSVLSQMSCLSPLHRLSQMLSCPLAFFT
jgi:hypothetical protein